MSKHYGWNSQHWRGMGWLELLAWVRAMNRQLRGGERIAPGGHDRSAEERNRAELDEIRRKMRGQ